MRKSSKKNTYVTAQCCLFLKCKIFSPKNLMQLSKKNTYVCLLKSKGSFKEIRNIIEIKIATIQWCHSLSKNQWRI